MEKAAFQCSNCQEVFHSDGLHLDIHGQAVAHICPACLDGVQSCHVALSREGPGKPFTFGSFVIQERIRDDTDPDLRSKG
jgi:predicted RNA-binding Zn-ribbon protein involved in translation (DUF1610 family)